MTDARRPRVVVVAEAAPMRGGIATFAETITADPRLLASFDMELLNTAREADREGGRLNLANVRHALADVRDVARAARTADIVHLQLVADPGLPVVRAAALVLAASLGRARVIAHSHSAAGNAGRPETARYSRLDRLLLRTLTRCAAVLTVSDAGTAGLRELLPARVAVRTIDNAIDVPQFTPAEHHAEVPVILFVGVICRRKGVPELARALARLRDQGIDRWKLVLVGSQGPTPQEEYSAIMSELDALGLRDSAVGAWYGERVRTALRESDIFVLPSYLEGQPMAILEAMATGLPVVSTRIGAVPQTVPDGVAGRVVEPGDVEGLAQALAELIGSPELRRRMGAAARRRAEERYDLPRLSEQLAEAYRVALMPRSARAATQSEVSR